VREHDELNEPGKFKSGDLRDAFARAEREHRELQRLKASGKPYAALDFHPERLTTEGG